MQRSFEKMNIKGAASGKDSEAKIAINLFPLQVTKNVPFFKHDVKVILTVETGHGPYTRVLSSENFDDSRHRCATIMAAMFQSGPVAEGAYDRAANLYSLAPIKETEQTVECAAVAGLDHPEGVISVKITPASDSFQASTNDLVACIPGRPGFQPNLLEAINVIEKEAYGQPDKWHSTKGVHFRNQGGEDLGGGVIIKPGLKTAAQVVGDNEKTLRLVVAADIKTVVQHVAQTVDKKMDALKALYCRDLGQVLQGLSVVPTYGKNRRPFTIQAISTKTILDIIEEQTVNNVRYFKERYQIDLKRTDLPMVAKRCRDRFILFPAEVLQILPNQSVPKERLMKAHDELIVKWSAMLPDVRAKMVTLYATDLGLFKSENLKRFGFELGPKWMELPCRVLNAVQVLGGDQKAVPPINSKVDLRNKTFHAPPALIKWAMINYGVDGQTFASFKDWFLEVIRQKGCQVDAPMEITISTELSAEALMKKAKDAGFLFVFIILADRLEIHDALKYYEQQYQVVTQITKSSVVRKAVERNQGVTLENILLKTCIKNAGIPYGVETMKGALKLRSNDALYIGLAYSHQQGTGGTSRRFKEVPSRVGYAATCSSHPNRVIGDFKFIEPHNNEAALNAIVEIVAQCVEAFTKNRIRPFGIWRIHCRNDTREEDRGHGSFQ